METTELHISTTGELYSFRPVGSGLEARSALFSALRYGDVLITYGIQGAGYFQGIKDHFDTICHGVRCVMGYVFIRHVAIYKRALRKKASVEVLFTGHPYGIDGPEMAWVMVTPTPPVAEKGRSIDTVSMEPPPV